jgi:fluoroquinolone resistance protein
MTRESTALRNRWTPELLEQAAQSFREGKVFTPFAPVTARDGHYLDLRGLTIANPLREVSLDRVDLSHSRFDIMGQFIDVTATNCLFAGASLETNLSGTYRACRFDDARMSGSTIFGGSSFSDCTFLRADLKKAKGGNVLFERCDFTAANLRGTRLSTSTFRDCIWTDAQFFHSSLGGSTISRSGFPAEKGTLEGDAILPDVILDNVKWLD